MSEVSKLAPSYIRSIAPYLPGKPISDLAREMGLDPASIIKLASNENPLGISPEAHIAMQDAMEDISRYPDGNSVALREAVSAKFGVQTDQIVFGNGSNDILELAARAFLSNGDQAVYAQHAFAVYALVTQAVGAKGVVVPAKDFGHDLPAMLAAINDKTRIVFIANPNNPTGTLIAKDALKEFLAKVPKHLLIVLDEAYDEYLSDEHKSEAIDWLKDFDNLIISRTFSKAYGLAGLRVGFGLTSSKIADLMNRVRQPFNVNSMAQVAAVASLADEAFVERTRALNQAGMVQITQGLSALGLEQIPSFGNFVSFKVADAAGVNHRLLAQGVIVRHFNKPKISSYLRITIGTVEQNQRLLDTLTNLV